VPGSRWLAAFCTSSSWARFSIAVGSGAHRRRRVAAVEPEAGRELAPRAVDVSEVSWRGGRPGACHWDATAGTAGRRGAPWSAGRPQAGTSAPTWPRARRNPSNVGRVCELLEQKKRGYRCIRRRFLCCSKSRGRDRYLNAISATAVEPPPRGVPFKIRSQTSIIQSVPKIATI
jgi:hypothetical protein